MNINNYSVENLIGSDINKATITLRKRLTKLFRNNGIDLTPEEFAILSRVWENEGILQNDLVDITLKDKTRVTRLLNNLQKKTLIYRVTNAQDKRKLFVFITDEGRSLQAIILPVLGDLMKEVSKGIPLEDLEITQRVLKQIFSNLNDAD